MESEYETTGNRTVKKIGGKEYWTSALAAEYLGIAKATILTHARQGRITSLRIGRGMLFNQKGLDDYIDEQTTIGKPSRKGGTNG